MGVLVMTDIRAEGYEFEEGPEFKQLKEALMTLIDQVLDKFFDEERRTVKDKSVNTL